MIISTNTITRYLPKRHQLDLPDTIGARQYIQGYWEHLMRYEPNDNKSLLSLPHPFLVPAFEDGHEFDFNEMYYWDSYFMIQGMLDEQHRELVSGILDNLISLFERYHIIPNANRTYLMGRSQPPFLTSFIFDVYDTYHYDEEWLCKRIAVAQKEYEIVWMGKVKPNARQVYQGLSRYYDINYLHDLAEAESGWDMTPRFGRKALNYIPIDLNSLLYKYEIDFARAHDICGHAQVAQEWRDQAKSRADVMNKLMWSGSRGLYYDFNYVKKRRSTVASLASYYPLWSGIATEKQARVLVKNLRRFEYKGGLSTTDGQMRKQFVPGVMPNQWAYPNGWAPLHLLVIQGLERYGYHIDAKRLAYKWLRTNLNWYHKHGVFLEKYNVVQPDKPPVKGVYPSQIGFGWTNAVFERLCRDYIDEKS